MAIIPNNVEITVKKMLNIMLEGTQIPDWET